MTNIRRIALAADEIHDDYQLSNTGDVAALERLFKLLLDNHRELIAEVRTMQRSTDQ